MAFEFNDQDPLARCKGESEKANDALNDHVLRGLSIRELQAHYVAQAAKIAEAAKEQATSEGHAEKPPTVVLSTLFGWSQKFKWQKRKARFKELEKARKRDEWRKKRVDLLEGFFGKTVEALRQFQGQDATLGQLTQAVKTAVQELRAEYDDLPTQRSEITGKDGGPVEITSIEVVKPNDTPD